MQSNPSDSSYTKGSGISASCDAAFAITNHWGISAGYRALKNKSIVEKDTNNLLRAQYGGVFNGNKYEFSLVYFTPINTHAIIEGQAGFALGAINRNGIRYPLYNYNTRYNNLFLQAAFGYYRKYFRLNVGLKYINQKYYSFESDNPDLKYRITNFAREIGTDITSKRYSFISTFSECEAGYKFIFFNLQYGMYIPIDNQLSYPFQPYISMGLTYRFNTKSFPQNNFDQQQ